MNSSSDITKRVVPSRQAVFNFSTTALFHRLAIRPQRTVACRLKPWMSAHHVCLGRFPFNAPGA